LVTTSQTNKFSQDWTNKFLPDRTNDFRPTNNFLPDLQIFITDQVQSF
jgi:hypothetical protein